MQDKSLQSTNRVLIVDSDGDCAEMYAAHLRTHGFETAVTTPGDMFDVLDSFNASIVLCNIEGEGAAGANLPGQLLEARPDLICVAMARRADLRQGGEFINKARGVEALVPTRSAMMSAMRTGKKRGGCRKQNLRSAELVQSP